MKNKTLKNLIVLGAFAVFLFGVNSVSASYGNYIPYGYNYNNNGYNSSYVDGYGNANHAYNQYTSYTEQQQYYTQQPYTYVAAPQQQIRYVQAEPQIKYVPVETVKYVTVGNTNSGSSNIMSNQGASVVGAGATKKVVAVNPNTGLKSNTGQYISYDPNQNGMLASAYGVYNGQVETAYDNNGVEALTVGGSGGFMPSSVFQWFLFILLVLAIIIVARMISKSLSRPAAHNTVTH